MNNIRTRKPIKDRAKSSSPASSGSDSPHSPTAQRFPPASSVVARGSAWPYARTSARANPPLPPSVGIPDYARHTRSQWAALRASGRTSSSSTRLLTPAEPPAGEGRVVRRTCADPALARRNGRSGPAVVAQRTLSQLCFGGIVGPSERIVGRRGGLGSVGLDSASLGFGLAGSESIWGWRESWNGSARR